MSAFGFTRKDYAVYDELPCGIVFIEPVTYRYLFLNKSAAAFIGYATPRDAMKDSNVNGVQWVHPEDSAQTLKVLQRLSETHRKQHNNCRLITKDGELKYTASTLSWHLTDDGVPYIKVTFVDNTKEHEERTRAQLANRKYETLLKNIPGGVILFDIGEQIKLTFCSEGLFEMIGMKPQEMLAATADNPFVFIHPEDVSLLESTLKTVLSKKGVCETIFRLRSAPETYRYVHLRCVWGGVDPDTQNQQIYGILTDADEKTRAEQDAELHRRRFNLVVNESDVTVWEYDIENGVVIPEPYHMLKQIPALPHSDFPQCFIDKGYIETDSIADYLQLHRRIVRGTVSASADIAFKINGIRTEWHRIKYVTIFDELNRPIRAMGCSVDITAQKEQEKMFNQELAFHRETNTDHLVASVRANVTKDLVSDCYNPVNGHSYARLTMTSLVMQASETIPNKEEREQFLALFLPANLQQNYKSGERRLMYEYHRVLADGHNSWVRTIIRMVEDPLTGDVAGFINTYNVDNYKTMNAVIERITKTNFDFMGLISLVDSEFVPLSVKPGVRLGLSGPWKYDAASLRRVSQNYDADAASIGNKGDLSTVIMNLENNDVYSFTSEMAENGVTARKQHSYMYLDEERNKIVVYRSDVTDVYREEQRQKETLRHALSLAEQSNIAKTEFLSRMSHEIRTPMNAIIGMANLANSSINDPVTAKECIDKVELSAKFLLELINDILDMSRIESGKMALNRQPFAIAELLQSVEIICSNLAKEKGVIYQQTCDNNVSVSYGGDQMKLKQVLINLINNAVKFTPAGGTVSLKAEEERIIGSEALMKFTIADTGIGMSPEFMKTMFEPFSQENTGSTSVYGGTGLGLAISRNLAYLMGGTIEVASEKGKGSVFTVWVKLDVIDTPVTVDHNDYQSEDLVTVDQIEHTEALSEIDVVNINFAGKRVLLVEDHMLNIEVAKKLLMAKDLEVDVAKNGKIGVDMFCDHTQNYYDAILMDIRMPVMDGIAATQVIRALHRPDAQTVPIIAMTANAFADDVEQTHKAGMNAHLAKPIEPDLLYRTLYQFIIGK